MERCNVHRAAPIMITGTDTGVGKTVASLMLMRFLFREGHSPFYWKPLQTGCLTPYDTDSDARFVYEHCPELAGQNPEKSVEYCFTAPKAPLYAARDEQSGIEMDGILRKLAYLHRQSAPLVIEGAGGLMVPVTAKYMVADLIQQAVTVADVRPVLVARAGLGTINHTLLSIEALRHRGVEPAGIVFSCSCEHSTPRSLVLENMEAVSTFSGISVSGVLPPITDFTNPPEDVWETFGRLLRSVYAPAA